MVNDKLTLTRLVLAIISTGLEELAIWAMWRRLLPDFGIELPVTLMIVVMVAWAAFGTWLFIFTTRTINKRGQAGQTSMVGTLGTVSSTLSPEGLVKIRGELWKAVSDGGKIEAGDDVVVVGQDGLKLYVRKIDGAGAKR